MNKIIKNTLILTAITLISMRLQKIQSRHLRRKQDKKRTKQF